MADAPDLEAPDLDVDENEDTFRRVVAVAVALIAFFGVFVAALQAVESNDEEVAARDAQRFAVTSLGAEVDAQAQVLADFGIAGDVLLLRQRQATAFGRIRRGGETGDLAHQALSDRLEAAADAVQAQTDVDLNDPASQSTATAAAFDRPDLDRLKQRVRADQANAHGGKADSYVAIITVLAVGLFLIGLSLTVQSRVRWVLAGPGLLIAIVCVGATGLVARRPVAVVTDTAAELAAEGQRAVSAGDFDTAIDLFDQAIEDSPEFFAPYARRANVVIQQDAIESDQTGGFISFLSEDALDSALPDIERALALGGDQDLGIAVTGSFLAFHDADFARSAELARLAIGINGNAVLPRLNLAVALMGLGDSAQALDALQTAFAVVEQIPDEGTVTQLVSALRTDLEVLRELADDGPADPDDVLALVEQVEGLAAEFEQEAVCGEAGCTLADPDVELELDEVTRNGTFVEVTFDQDGAALGEQVGFSWFFRTAGDQAFRQAGVGSMTMATLSDFGDGEQFFTSGAALLDPFCPVEAEYLVRAWVGDEPVGEFTFEVGPSPLGESFTTFEDPILGYSMCQADGFEDSPLQDAEFVEQFGPQVQFERDDELIVPFVVRGIVDPEVIPLDDPDTRDEVAGGFLQGFLSDDALDGDPFLLFGRSLQGTFGVALEGRVATGELDGVTHTVFAAVDSLGTLRAIDVAGFDDPAAAEEIFRLVFFFDLPEPAQ